MYYSVMPNRSIVAGRIENLLRMKGMSAAELSAASQVTESAISNILSGKRQQPRSDTIQKIANAFPTSTDYLKRRGAIVNSRVTTTLTDTLTMILAAYT